MKKWQIWEKKTVLSKNQIFESTLTISTEIASFSQKKNYQGLKSTISSRKWQFKPTITDSRQKLQYRVK